jgi:hypothetical protein
MSRLGLGSRAIEFAVGETEMRSLNRAMDNLTALPMYREERPATESEIADIEAQLDVVLPDQYKQFLRRHGYVSCFGKEILGIRPRDPMTGQPSTTRSDCVSRTKRERDPSNPIGTAGLDRNHVIISTDGGGGNFVLYTRGSPVEGEVHWYSFEDQGDPIMSWKTLQDYLEYIIDEAIGA